MRNCLVGLILALVAVLTFSSVLRAQTTEESKAPKAQIAAPSPDLSGVWLLPRQPTKAHWSGTNRSFGINPTFATEEPPMTPWAEAKYKAVNSAYEGANGRADLIDPVYDCFPPGVPRIYIERPVPMEIIQVSGRVIELFEYDHFVRQIYTDGREHSKDLAGTWMGDSIGRWEGDTLVVDTTGFNDKTLVDKIGHPHSDALHVVERIRRVDHNTLVIDITIDDPKAYTKPWGGRLSFQLKPGWNILELVCEDNVNFNEFHKKSTAEPSK
jgi:hypothetical protein